MRAAVCAEGLDLSSKGVLASTEQVGPVKAVPLQSQALVLFWYRLQMPLLAQPGWQALLVPTIVLLLLLLLTAAAGAGAGAAVMLQ